MRQCLLYIFFLRKQHLKAPLDILAMIQLPPARVGRQAVPVLGDMGKPTMRGIRLSCSATTINYFILVNQEVSKVWNLQRNQRTELQK